MQLRIQSRDIGPDFSVAITGFLIDICIVRSTERIPERFPKRQLSHIRPNEGIQRRLNKVPIFRSDTSFSCISIVVVHANQEFCREVPVTRFPPSRSENGFCGQAGRGWSPCGLIKVAWTWLRSSLRMSSLCIVTCVSTMSVHRWQPRFVLIPTGYLNIPS